MGWIHLADVPTPPNMAMANNNSNGLRTQYSYGADALSPRPPYDLPSPTSNYPSGVSSASPGFYPMAYQHTPRFGSSAFVPPPDVFQAAHASIDTIDTIDMSHASRARRLELLNNDPVGMHLLVETALGDSQSFEVLSVEAVEALKQEQRTLGARLATARKRLESESKIRDAAVSLTRLTSISGKGHSRHTSSRASNATREPSPRSQEELKEINQKVEDYTRDLLETEARMREIDMKLLMHTSAVLQLTHNVPASRTQSLQDPNTGGQRPDSPASMVMYDTNGNALGKGDDIFDERSLYRSPENLDGLMHALQNGAHHQTHSPPQPQSVKRNSEDLHNEALSTEALQALVSNAKRIEELNARVRGLMLQANPERNREYQLPPRLPTGSALDADAVDEQIDFLDQSLRDISAELDNTKNTSTNSLNEVEGRLDGVNNQLYALLSKADEQALPPPPIGEGDVQEPLNYMEDSFYNLQQIHFSMSEQLDDLRSQADMMAQQMDQLRSQASEDLRTQEETLTQQMDQLRSQASEDLQSQADSMAQQMAQLRLQASEDQQSHADALSQQMDQLRSQASEDLRSQEESMTQELELLRSQASEDLRSQQESTTQEIDQLRLQASKNQDSQYEAMLMGLWSIIQAGEGETRQRKQKRRELLSASPDADEEMSADEEYDANEAFSLATFSAKVQWLYKRASMLKEKHSILVRQIKQQRELNSQSDAQKEEQFDQLKEQLLNARSESSNSEQELERAMIQLKDFDQHKIDSDSQALRDAQDHIDALESQLKQAQDDARVDAAAMQAELSAATSRMDEITSALLTASAEIDATEARSIEANQALRAKEEEMRELEGEVVRLTTELTMAKAELDGAYGTRAERAAENGGPVKRELEELSARNLALMNEIEALKKAYDAASMSEAEARESEKTLKQELLGMTADYEALTRDSIQNEKDRDVLEATIDKLRDEKEGLELELSDERVKWLGIRSPSVAANGVTGSGESTSIRMLREDFRKMIRDRTAEGLRALRNEQEERRRLEALVRTLRKEAAPQRSNLSKQITA